VVNSTAQQLLLAAKRRVHMSLPLVQGGPCWFGWPLGHATVRVEAFLVALLPARGHHRPRASVRPPSGRRAARRSETRPARARRSEQTASSLMRPWRNSCWARPCAGLRAPQGASHTLRGGPAGHRNSLHLQRRCALTAVLKNSRTPTVAQELQNRLDDPAEADSKHFYISWSAIFS